MNYNLFIVISLYLVMTATVTQAQSDNYSFERSTRIDEKYEDHDVEKWRDKHAKESALTPLSLDKSPYKPPFVKKDFIGFTTDNIHELDSYIWNRYTKKNLKTDIDLIKKSDYLTIGQRSLIKELLLYPAKAPSGFNDNTFLVFRLETLLDLGFNKDALNLLKTYYKAEQSPSLLIDNVAKRIKFANNLLKEESLIPTEQYNLTKLSNLHRIATNNAFPLEERLNAFKKGFKYHLFDRRTLNTLFLEDEAFSQIVNQDHFLSFKKTKTLEAKLEIMTQQLSYNLNPALPESLYFYPHIKKLTPSDSFQNYTNLMIYYLGFNLHFDKADKWIDYQNNIGETKEIVDLQEKNKKICNFLNFSLAFRKSIMLKLETEVENNMANPIEDNLDTLGKAVLNANKELCSGNVDNTDLALKESRQLSMLKRFKSSVTSKDKAQTALLATILWNSNVKKTQKMSDLKKNVKFILQNLNKSDLNNYVFALSRDNVTKR